MANTENCLYYCDKLTSLRIMDHPPPNKKQLKDKALAVSLENVYQNLYDTALSFEEQAIHDTIVFFGSSQICSWEDAQTKMKEVELVFEESKEHTQKQWDLLDHASNMVYMSRYFEAAVELSMKLAQWSKKLKNRKKNFIVCSGGGPGIMEATNKGAYLAGSRSIGLTIDIAEEQGLNYYITPELKYNFHSFFIRKFWFFQYARAAIVFPGGMGTLDEFFEILTLMKTKKTNPRMPVVLFGTEYWKEILNFELMARFNMIEERDLLLFKHADTVDEAYDFVTERLKDCFLEK